MGDVDIDNGEERQRKYHDKVRVGYMQFYKDMHEAYVRYDLEQQKEVFSSSPAGKMHLINQHPKVTY